jgi:SAM-dependent methyltransferase
VSRASHWDTIYASKGEQDVSWFEAVPAVSLAMIEAAGLTSETCVLDVGGGQSRLVDALLARGLDCVTVLDLSREALHHAQARLGDAARTVRWISADVAGAWSIEPVDIWHDRAVFHFLTNEDDRAGYVAHLVNAVKANGSVIIATFAPDGPDRCSGLPVVRYSPQSLAAELGGTFSLVESRPHRHATPWGAAQSFQYSRFRRVQ